jgi:secreted trypsin-like serine protease
MYEVFTFAALIVGGIFIKDYVKVGGNPALFALLFVMFSIAVAASTAARGDASMPSSAVTPVGGRKLCGLQSPIPTNYVVSGRDAYPGKWPWIAFIAKPVVGGVERSSGFLISDRWIVTCAHTAPDKTMSVTLGAFDVSQSESTRITATVEKVVVHPNYSRGTPDSNYNLNDIALIKLTGPVTFTPNIQPVCLPRSSSYPGTTSGQLIVTGWNLARTNPSSRLTDVSLAARAAPVCANFLKGFSGQGQLCLTNADSATDCSADSGGPVVVQKNGYWYAVGIVSYGYCDPLIPAVYTDTSYYLDFIRQTLAAG